MRQQSDQFTLLVREVPLCIEHKAHGCNVEHFFSKYHPYTYHSYQILSDVKELDDLLVNVLKLLEDLRYSSYFILMFSLKTSDHLM